MLAFRSEYSALILVTETLVLPNHWPGWVTYEAKSDICTISSRDELSNERASLASEGEQRQIWIIASRPTDMKTEARNETKPPNDPGARSANWGNGGKKYRLIATQTQKLQRCPKIENLSNAAPNLSQYFLTRLSLNSNILWTLWPTKLSQICRSPQIVAHNSLEEIHR